MIHDKRGMTLIEIMIALLLMTIVAVALMQATIMVMNNNVKNELRDEAVSVAEQIMNEVRNTQFADLATSPTTTTRTRNIRAFTVTYTALLSPTVVNTNAMQETLTIEWIYRGRTYQHSVSTVLRSK